MKKDEEKAKPIIFCNNNRNKTENTTDSYGYSYSHGNKKTDTRTSKDPFKCDIVYGKKGVSCSKKNKEKNQSPSPAFSVYACVFGNQILPLVPLVFSIHPPLMPFVVLPT